MLTKEQRDNLKRNFSTGSERVLTVKAHNLWRPIILQLLDEHASQQPNAADGDDS